MVCERGNGHNGEWIRLLHSVSSFSSKNWKNLRLRPDPRRFAAWEFLYRNNCFQNAHLEKTDQLLYRQHGHSDLLNPTFLFPKVLTYLYTGSWLISGPLGQALCKLAHCLTDVSFVVSIQSLLLIAVDRFGAVLFPLRIPLISPKLCSFFILATWIIAMAVISPYLVAFKLAVYPEQLPCLARWNEAFGESFSVKNFHLAMSVVFYYVPIVMLVILYSIIVIKLFLYIVISFCCEPLK